MASRESIIKIADQWLESHKVSESWRIINMLRDELVRHPTAPPTDDEREGR